MKTMKPRGPFKFISRDHADVLKFEAEFPLADDGTPGGERHLIVRVETGPHNHVGLYIKCRDKLTHVADGFSNIDKVSNLLYGAATTEITKTIRPLIS